MRRMMISPGLTDLIYPLDVYAALVQHHAGYVPALGFGSLTEAEAAQAMQGSSARAAMVLIEAQQRQYRKLIESIDSGRLRAERSQPVRVLEIGCGRGALALMLAAAGFEVTALDCSATVMDAQLRDASVNQDVSSHDVSGQDASSQDVLGNIEAVTGDFLSCAAAEWQHRRFDLIVLQNSARYFLPMQLLSALKSLLASGAELVILDEFMANTADSHQPARLPVLDHFLALAERLGFERLQQHDLNATTLPFQRLLCHLFEQTLPALPQLTNYPLAQLSSLYQSLCEETAGTEQGLHLHVLLHFRKAFKELPDTLELIPASALSAEAFAPVFESSFDVKFDAELWRWKYEGGRGASVAAVRDGQVLAHYGGVVRAIRYFGESSRAVQICDVMVLPGERSFFSRHGLFFKTAATMLEQYAGYQADNLLGFGFPNLKAMHVAERLKLYEKTDELMQLTVQPDVVVPAGWHVESETAETVVAAAGLLWPQMESGFADAIVGVRDVDYLHYRYQQRPGLHYEWLQVMDGETVKGLGVRRRHGEGWLLMDILAAPSDLAPVLALLLQAGNSDGAVCFWLTAGQLHRVQSVDDSGKNVFDVSSTGIQIPCNRWSRGPETGRLYGRWWLTAGDMDFL